MALAIGIRRGLKDCAKITLSRLCTTHFQSHISTSSSKGANSAIEQYRPAYGGSFGLGGPFGRPGNPNLKLAGSEAHILIARFVR